jgi:glycine/D-amino acid oxidase-like deaminating enzyme/nitrite reductase/ring-hydroxylating ferredoxin subunit
MNTASYWIDTGPLPRYPQLHRDLEADVVVIGGGITGITAAYLFKKAGYRAILLERERCAAMDTGHTSGHLTCVMDKPLHKLVDDFGKDHARACWDAGLAAIDQVVATIREEAIACEFRWSPGYLHAPVDTTQDDALDRLRKDAELAGELGFDANFIGSVPLVERPGIRFPNQAKFHPRKYVQALLHTIPGAGSHVFEHSAVDNVEDNPLTVHVGTHKIACNYIVVATHSPLMGKSGVLSATLLQTKLFLYTSYIVGARVEGGELPEAMFWDTGDPYYYLRIDRHPGYDYVIFGGEDHKTGQEQDTASVFGRLEAKLHEIIPAARVDHRWSGQVVETPDGLPYIGETSERQFVVTGFVGQGMTFGTLGGMMAIDAFTKRKNPWSDLFAPDRKALKSGKWDYVKENAAFPFYLVRDRLARAEGDSLKDLGRGEGKLLSIDGRKVAAYRDEHGTVTLVSPVCTHLKCIVAWNNAEKTWDCPCHGSRFKATGEVMAGPAEKDLERIPLSAEVSQEK